MTINQAYLSECRQRDESRPTIERAREAVNDASYQEIASEKAKVLTALATAEALGRIATSLERVAKEMDEDAEAIRSFRHDNT